MSTIGHERVGDGLLDEFMKKAVNFVAVNRQSFVDAVLKNFDPATLGYARADYDWIVAIR